MFDPFWTQKQIFIAVYCQENILAEIFKVLSFWINASHKNLKLIFLVIL